jgi:hypothetical protein
MGNLLLHSLKGMVGSGGSNSVRGRRIVCLEPLISVAMQCSFKPLTMACCHPRGPMEVTIFHVLPMDYRATSMSIVRVNFFVKTFSAKKLMKTKDTAIKAESSAF